jgi:hypothetical protein
MANNWQYFFLRRSVYQAPDFHFRTAFFLFTSKLFDTLMDFEVYYSTKGTLRFESFSSEPIFEFQFQLTRRMGQGRITTALMQFVSCPNDQKEGYNL